MYIDYKDRVLVKRIFLNLSAYCLSSLFKPTLTGGVAGAARLAKIKWLDRSCHHTLRGTGLLCTRERALGLCVRKKKPAHRRSAFLDIPWTFWKI